MTHAFEVLLEWEKNIEQYVDYLKRIIVWKFFRKCPSCHSDNLQFVECRPGGLEKWFCRDCTAMTYSYACKHCGKRNWVFGAFKAHIYREYRLGKYRGYKRFYRKSNEVYIKDQIRFYLKGLSIWKLKFNEFRKHKQYKLKYGEGR